MMLKILSKVLIVTGIMILGTSTFALTNSANQTLSFTNGIGAELTFAGNTVNFGTVTPNIPITQTNAATVKGSSNGTWVITLSGTDFTSTTSKTTVPIGRLSVRKVETDSFTPITNAGIALISGHVAGEANYTIDYKLATTLADNAANGLTTNLTYTISAQ